MGGEAGLELVTTRSLEVVLMESWVVCLHVTLTLALYLETD